MGPQQRKPILMIVEPDVLVRMALAEHLRDCGYRVIEGTSAADVDGAIGAGIRPDCVMAEVQLRGSEDGFALAKRLRQTHPGIDVILAAGAASAALKSTHLCAKNGVIMKPYQTREIEARLRSLAARRAPAK